MLRNILAAVVGYIAIVAALFALSSLLWLTLGPSHAFQPGTWEVAGGWVLGSIVIGFAGRTSADWSAPGWRTMPGAPRF